MIKKQILNFIFLISFSLTLFSQEIDDDFIGETKVYKTEIKTLQAAREGWELTYPIIHLNTDERIQISFDLLGSTAEDFYYTFIHCNSNWQVSDLLFSEYCDGFQENTIRDFDYSVNTFQDYVHYNLFFPNDDVQPIISGNYLLVVYQNGDMNQLVLTKRLFVSQSEVGFNYEVKRAITSDLTHEGQRVNFEVYSQNSSTSDEYMKAIVQQNGRLDNIKNNLEPKFRTGSKVVYQDEIENVFIAGNEFRHFDIKNEEYLPLGVEDIQYIKPFYHFKLATNYSRNTNSYITKQDLNGEYFIQKEGSEDSYKSADYFYVHFRLSSNEMIGSDVFIVGALTNWNLSDENKMTYNYRTGNYETKLFLKQGYYNYAYVLRDNKTGKLDYSFFEGSFSETENKYIIYVYDTNPTNRYQKLLGVKIVTNLQ